MEALSKRDLNQFSGDLVRFRHSINRRVIYTPGVRHVAEDGGAYWLIDAIASHIGSPEFNKAADRDYRIGTMHFWTLPRNGSGGAELFAKADSPEDAFIVQDIPFTDFPMTSIDISAAFDGEHWTLYLPSEH
ncbi:DUF6876 family protein [Rhodopirellula europaea]|uniref:DUF6876 family protein n=1 Tax=Rhodopirellula europaea TaxID=1263866 RepID=UPI003D28AAB8